MAQELNDHDMLVVLNTKVDQVLLLQTDLVGRVAKTEARLDAMDVFHAGIQLQKFDDDHRWVENIRANFKLMITLYGLCSAIAGGLIARVAFLLFHF